MADKGGEDEAIQLKSVQVRRRPAVVESNRLQSGESVATIGTAKKIGNWAVTSLQGRLVKTGGGLISHARYYWAAPG